LAAIDNVLHFLGCLRAGLSRVLGESALVLWYDSVTTLGQLKWQNGEMIVLVGIRIIIIIIMMMVIKPIMMMMLVLMCLLSLSQR
jgi:hypothetical protein